MEWNLETIIYFLGAMGIGGVIGILVKHFLERKENKRKLLFEARVKAYGGLVGRLFNLFNELDINKLKEALRVAKINQLLSEAYLLGSHQLVELIGEFKPVLFAFHRELDDIVRNGKKDEDEAKSLHTELVTIIGKIYNQMRNDLFIDKVNLTTLVEGAIDSGNLLILKGLTPKKIAERNKQTIKEIKKTEDLADSLPEDSEAETLGEEENVTIPEADYGHILPKIEAIVLDKLEKSLNQKIERQINFTGLDKFSFDGGIINNEIKLLRLFEIKVFPKLPRNKSGKVMTFAIVENLRIFLADLVPELDKFLGATSGKAEWKHILTIVVILNTKTDFIKIRRRIEELRDEFSKIIKNLQINFVFYNLKNMDLALEKE